jgi:hypothetical protein
LWDNMVVAVERRLEALEETLSVEALAASSEARCPSPAA